MSAACEPTALDPMKTFLRLLWKTAATLAVVMALGVLFVYSGFYNVAATAGHTKLVERVLRTMKMRSVVAHAREITVPPNFNSKDRALAERGAGHYEMMCRTCHGAPGKKPDPWQLYPPVPDLADALHVMRWTDAEVFWIIKNGIKDTAMGAFGGSGPGAHSDEEIWGMTALIRQLETITPEQYHAMSERAMAQQKEGAHQPTGRDTQQAPSQHQQQQKAAPRGHEGGTKKGDSHSHKH